MSDQDTFVIEDNKKHNKHSAHDEFEKYSGYNFGSDLCFTVGISYLLASSVGLVKGLVEGFPTNFSLPKKLLLNNFFNSLGKNQSTFGQKAAGAGFLYYGIGTGMNFFFEDQFENLTDFQKNITIGSITGLIFTTGTGGLGFIRGTLGGAAIIGGLSLFTDYLHSKQYLSFQVKF
ncbi:hypothetical protein ABPG74_005938 [Tetrahymena malaccensis]